VVALPRHVGERGVGAHDDRHAHGNGGRGLKLLEREEQALAARAGARGADGAVGLELVRRELVDRGLVGLGHALLGLDVERGGCGRGRRRR